MRLAAALLACVLESACLERPGRADLVNDAQCEYLLLKYGRASSERGARELMSQAKDGGRDALVNAGQLYVAGYTWADRDPRKSEELYQAALCIAPPGTKLSDFTADRIMGTPESE